MKTILSVSIALLVGVFASEPVYARNNRGGGGGGGRVAMARAGGGARAFANPGRSMARVQAPSFNPGRSMARAPMAAPRSMAMPRTMAAPRTMVQPQLATTRAGRTGGLRGGNLTAARAPRTGTASPTIAFGGTSTRRGGGSFTVPRSVSGGWEHGRVHEWNHHRFAWRGNDWVILDAGDPYAYGYDYPYGYDAGDTYATVSTSAPNLTASVQQALDDQGYEAGPADGVIGPQTRDAIASFQADHGLRPTGDINGRLLSALGL